MNMNPNDVDNRLIAGDAQVNFAGPACRRRPGPRSCPTRASRRTRTTRSPGSAGSSTSTRRCAPFTKVACRQAIEYAANQTTLQNAYGGPVAGGAIGSTVMPPTVTGYQKFDLYEATTKPSGDPAKAKRRSRPAVSPTVSRPGSPTGVTGPPRRRAPRPCSRPCPGGDQAHAARVPDLHVFQRLRWRPEVHELAQHRDRHRRLGADWPDGYGFLDELVNGNTIVPAGNTNIGMLNDPVVNNLFAKAAGINNAAQRNAIWGQIDQQVMKDAVIVPRCTRRR